MNLYPFIKRITEDHELLFNFIESNEISDSLCLINKDRTTGIVIHIQPYRTGNDLLRLTHEVSVWKTDETGKREFVIQNVPLNEITLEKDGRITAPQKTRINIFGD